MTMLAAAGAGVGALGKLGSGFANSSLAQFSASIAQGNEQLALGQGQLAAAQGAQQIGRVATATNAAVANERGKFSASGLNPDFGSPLLMQSNSILQGQGDQNIIAARTSAAQASARAAAASAAGNVAALNMQSADDIMAGYYGAGSTLLSGMGKAFGGVKWPWSPGGGGGASTVGAFGLPGSAGALY
jgi:hypothetical protein